MPCTPGYCWVYEVPKYSVIDANPDPQWSVLIQIQHEDWWILDILFEHCYCGSIYRHTKGQKFAKVAVK